MILYERLFCFVKKVFLSVLYACTTILERGVTFPNIDVIVYEADHQVFNTASLVQISGRVGRKAEYPTGKIIFIHKGKTKSINEAIKQIKLMNQKAGFE